jgi:hypothetical protein
MREFRHSVNHSFFSCVTPAIVKQWGSMALRDEIKKRIDRKRSEISDMQAMVRDAEIYIQALEDTIRLLPRDTDGVDTSADLRPGSRVAKAREFLRKAGAPQQIMSILEGIGEQPTPASRAALSGSLSAYVRKGEIFTRPSPNVFGLNDFAVSNRPAKNTPPPEFGEDEQAEEDGGFPWDTDNEEGKDTP